MATQPIKKEIEQDIRRRFNNVEEFSEIKIRKNAKAHTAYVNELKDGTIFSVGIIYIKGNPVRVLIVNKEGAFEF